jgi:hypothetical protein
MSQGPSLSRFRNTLVNAQRGCQAPCPLFFGSCGVLGILYVPISYRDSPARPRDDNRLREEGKVGGICTITPPAQYNMSCSTVLVIEGEALQSYVSLHGAGRAANDLSKQPQNWAMGRKSRSRHLAKTSTGGPLPTYFCPMAPTSITRWSKMAGVGGIGSMHRWIRCWKG